MAVADFDQLCQGLCEVAGCAMPEQAVNEHGARAVSFRLDGVEVTLAQEEARGPRQAFVLTRFGRLPEGREHAACIALLQTNSLMLRSGSPSFGVDPLTSDVLLHHSVVLDEVNATELYNSIVRFVEIAHSKRATHFLDPAHRLLERQQLPFA